MYPHKSGNQERMRFRGFLEVSTCWERVYGAVCCSMVLYGMDFFSIVLFTVALYCLVRAGSLVAAERKLDVVRQDSTAERAMLALSLTELY